MTTIENNENTAQDLVSSCSEVRVRINWFGTSSKVDALDAAEMLAPSLADRKAVSISKKLMSSKNPKMIAAKQARDAITAHVAAWTVPMLALSGGTSDVLRKDAGIRLIKKCDMEVFDERLQYLAGVLKTAAEQLQSAMPSIKEEDRIRLGRLYRDTDYPADVTKLIGVEVSYKQAGVDLDWEHLCPKIFERERMAAKEKFEKVVENAAVEFATRFVKYVQQVTDQLGSRVRLNPMLHAEQQCFAVDDNSDVYASTVDAEVVTILRHADAPDVVPEGSVLLELRLKKQEKGRSTTLWMRSPVTEKYYQESLRPRDTTERKKLYNSTIENLKAELETFVNIGELLGPYRGIVEDSVAKVRETLGKASSNLDTDKIVSALREGEYFRNEMRTALAGVAIEVQSAVSDVKEIRRRISKKHIGKV